eukprot:gene7225-14735_t
MGVIATGIGQLATFCFVCLFFHQSLWTAFHSSNYSSSNKYTEDKAVDILVQPLIPGFNMPSYHIFSFWLIALFVLTVHELGHAVCACCERLHILSCGAFFFLLFPGAYVRIEDSVQYLPTWAQLRIYCAGVWNNIILCMACWTAMLLLPHLLCVLYLRVSGAVLTGVSTDSPLSSVMHPGAVITSLNGLSVLSSSDISLHIRGIQDKSEIVHQLKDSENKMADTMFRKHIYIHIDTTTTSTISTSNRTVQQSQTHVGFGVCTPFSVVSDFSTHYPVCCDALFSSTAPIGTDHHTVIDPSVSASSSSLPSTSAGRYERVNSMTEKRSGSGSGSLRDYQHRKSQATGLDVVKPRGPRPRSGSQSSTSSNPHNHNHNEVGHQHHNDHLRQNKDNNNDIGNSRDTNNRDIVNDITPAAGASTTSTYIHSDPDPSSYTDTDTDTDKSTIGRGRGIVWGEDSTNENVNGELICVPVKTIVGETPSGRQRQRPGQDPGQVTGPVVQSDDYVSFCSNDIDCKGKDQGRDSRSASSSSGGSCLRPVSSGSLHIYYITFTTTGSSTSEQREQRVLFECFGSSTSEQREQRVLFECFGEELERVLTTDDYRPRLWLCHIMEGMAWMMCLGVQTYKTTVYEWLHHLSLRLPALLMYSLRLTFQLSLSVAVLNMLPVPYLDGGLACPQYCRLLFRR